MVDDSEVIAGTACAPYFMARNTDPEAARAGKNLKILG
jgi:hypothetical protein